MSEDLEADEEEEEEAEEGEEEGGGSGNATWAAAEGGDSSGDQKEKKSAKSKKSSSSPPPGGSISAECGDCLAAVGQVSWGNDTFLKVGSARDKSTKADARIRKDTSNIDCLCA